jgi:hypothetical protein
MPMAQRLRLHGAVSRGLVMPAACEGTMVVLDIVRAELS